MLAKDITEGMNVMLGGVKHKVSHIFRRKNVDGNIVIDIFLTELGNGNYTKITCAPGDIIKTADNN